jgi:transcriptional regulator of NAD metabolism
LSICSQFEGCLYACSISRAVVQYSTKETHISNLKEETFEVVELSLSDGQESSSTVIVNQISKLCEEKYHIYESMVAPVARSYARKASLAISKRVVPFVLVLNI